MKRIASILVIFFLRVLLPVAGEAAGLDTSILPAPDAQGKWGYVDAASGKTLIAPQFHEAGFFYDGVAIVTYAYPDKAHDAQLVDSFTGKTTVVSTVPTAQGVINRNGRNILVADRLKRANTLMSEPYEDMYSRNNRIYIPRLFLARKGNGESAVFHADKGVIVPPGKYKDIRFTPEGAVYCDGVYYEPNGKRHDPPRGGGITNFEPETGTFRVVKGKGIKEMNAPEGVMRLDGSLIVPMKYDDVKAVPEAGIWLASREDVSSVAKGTVAFLTHIGSLLEIKEDEDILTVDVYDATGKVLRSFRSRYNPGVSGITYTYKSKGRDYRVDARTGAAVPDGKKEPKEEEPPADPTTGFRPFKEDGKYGIKNAAGAVSVPPAYDAVKSLGGGLFAASREKTEYRRYWGVIDGAGKEIIPFIYYSIYRVSYPSPTTTTGPLVCEQYTGDSYKGWTPVQRADHPAPPLPKDMYWFVGRDGRFITPEDKPYDDYPVDFSFNAVGLAVVQRDHKRGVIDYTGKEVLPCAYNDVDDGLKSSEDKKSWGKGKVNSDKDAASKVPLTVKDALFWVKRNELWGLYDGTGKEVIPIQYKKIDISEPGMEWVKVRDEKEKAGLVNIRTGQIIAPKYDYVTVYPGFFLAKIEIRGDKRQDVYIVLNGKGEETARFEMEIWRKGTEWFADAGVLAIEQNDKWALFGKTGKQLCPFRYDYVNQAPGPFVWGKIKEEPVLVDGTGKEYRIH